MFAKRLKELRQDLGLTQAEMAHRLNIDASTYCRWEQKVKPPIHIIERISKQFNVDAFNWVERDNGHGSEQADVSKPRVVHFTPVQPNTESTDEEWRSRAVDLLGRMVDMLETLLRGSRGGGVNSAFSTGYATLSSLSAPHAIIPAPIANASSSMSKAAVCKPLCEPGFAGLPVPKR